MPAGRPPKFDDERARTIIEHIRRGHYIETAAAAAGVNKVTLYRWLNIGYEKPETKYGEFCNAVEKAMAEADIDDLDKIQSRAFVEWQAAAWRLERRNPRIFAQRVQHTVQLEIDSFLHLCKARLTQDEYEKVVGVALEFAGHGPRAYAALPAPGRTITIGPVDSEG